MSVEPVWCRNGHFLRDLHPDRVRPDFPGLAFCTTPLATYRLRYLIGVDVLPNHSGIGDGWSGGVNLLDTIEVEAVAAVEGDRSWVLFRYP